MSKSLSIVSFKLIDPRAEEAVIKTTIEKLAQSLRENKVFARVDTTGEVQADLTLEGAVTRYKQISGIERAAAVLIGPAFSYLVMELRLMDNNAKRTIAVIQVNSVDFVGMFWGLGALRSARPETLILEYLTTILIDCCIKNAILMSRKREFGPIKASTQEAR